MNSSCSCTLKKLSIIGKSESLTLNLTKFEWYDNPL